MKTFNNTLTILLFLTFLLSSCSSKDDEEEKNPYEGRHADFYPREDFNIGKNYQYFLSNREGYEGTIRSEKEMEQHRPLVKIEDDGAKLIISFPSHPHKPKHYWAWFEVIDKNGTEFYEELDEPAEEEKDFKFVVVPEKPFRHRIRVRAFCFVHGEFQEYVDLPEFEEKSIIDR